MAFDSASLTVSFSSVKGQGLSISSRTEPFTLWTLVYFCSLKSHLCTSPAPPSSSSRTSYAHSRIALQLFLLPEKLFSTWSSSRSTIQKSLSFLQSSQQLPLEQFMHIWLTHNIAQEHLFVDIWLPNLTLKTGTISYESPVPGTAPVI